MSPTGCGIGGSTREACGKTYTQRRHGGSNEGEKREVRGESAKDEKDDTGSEYRRSYDSISSYHIIPYHIKYYDPLDPP